MGEKKVPKIDLKFDGAFKRFVAGLPDESIVRFVNSVFDDGAFLFAR